MAGMGQLDVAAKWLIIIGGLNWGIAGIGGFLQNASLSDGVVAMLGTTIANIVYVLVGLAAVYTLYGMFGKK